MGMNDDTLQDVVSRCKNCAVMTADVSTSDLKMLRDQCAHCRKGISKYDAIRTALNAKQFPRNVGKKPIMERRYGAAIRNLYEQGMRKADIVRTLGISKSTVYKILKEEE